MQIDRKLSSHCWELVMTLIVLNLTGCLLPFGLLEPTSDYYIAVATLMATTFCILITSVVTMLCCVMWLFGIWKLKLNYTLTKPSVVVTLYKNRK